LEKTGQIIRTESALLKGARKYFEQNHFTEVVVPHLTRGTGACENIDTMFTVDWFGGRPVYLCQTGQLYLETLIPTINKVWCSGPSFRAEPDVDNRHLAEFTLVEFEFAGRFKKLLEHIEQIMKTMVWEAARKELETPFKKITYERAVKELGLEWGTDLKHAHEQELVKKHGNKPLFITHFPEEIKFFNMINNQENSKVVNSADLILPHSGEAVGAAERVHEYQTLKKKLKESTMLRQLEAKGGGIKDFDWYLQHVKEKGSVPHAGCGIGLNRVTQFVLGEQDIRNTTAYPVNKVEIK
jgi:asparaginyl-tRNA synthetase